MFIAELRRGAVAGVAAGAMLTLGPAPSYAGGSGAVMEPVDDFIVAGATNPCTGATVDVLHTDVTGTFRSAATPSGEVYHELEMLRGTATTSDGFTGHYAQRFVVTDLDPGTFADFVATDQVAYEVHGPAHQTVRYRLRVHLRAIAGEIVASAEVLDARCVGRS